MAENVLHYCGKVSTHGRKSLAFLQNSFSRIIKYLAIYWRLLYNNRSYASGEVTQVTEIRIDSGLTSLSSQARLVGCTEPSGLRASHS